MGDDWQDLDTAPEDTWILCWCSYHDGKADPKIFVDKFTWRNHGQWEEVSNTGRRRVQVWKEKMEREWTTLWGAEKWMPLPAEP